MNPATREFVSRNFNSHEQLYLRFASISLKKQTKKQISSICLMTDEIATTQFLNFLHKFYQDHKITDRNYRVKDTFSAVYTVVKNEIKRISDENELDLPSDNAKTMLTLFQARLFIHYAREVWIPASPLSIDQYACSLGLHNLHFLLTNGPSSNLAELNHREKNVKKLRRVTQTKAVIESFKEFEKTQSKVENCSCDICKLNSKEIKSLINDFGNHIEVILK